MLVTDSIAIAEVKYQTVPRIFPVNVSDTIAVVETVAGFNNKDIEFTVTVSGAATPRFDFANTQIDAYIDDVWHSTFTSGVPNTIPVLVGEVLRYTSSNSWTNVTKVFFDGDFITGDIGQFAWMTSLSTLVISSTELSGNLSQLAELTMLISLQAHTTNITADAGCLDTQILMTECQVHNCDLSASEMDNLLASLVVNEAAGSAGRDCVVSAN